MGLDNKKLTMNRELDIISRLPEGIMHHIRSFLPLKDAARLGILSKTWNDLCGSYPILHLDHNLFALPLLLCAEGRQTEEPQIGEIREKFMDVVDNRLLRVLQGQNLKVLKLALTVVLNDSKDFSRVDHWMELVKQAAYVKELYLFVETNDYNWDGDIYAYHLRYNLPLSVLTTKGLKSVSVRGCMLSSLLSTGEDTNNRVVGSSFSSLQQLCLTKVYLDKDALSYLMRWCPEIEGLEFSDCNISTEVLELSKFPKLKKASLMHKCGDLEYVKVEGTNLNSLTCEAYDVTCEISPAAYSSLKKLVLQCCSWNCSFEDLTASFPALKEADMGIHGTERLKAVANHLLRRLVVSSDTRAEEIYIDCLNLRELDFQGYNVKEVYINCPNLREFSYSGCVVPKLHLFNPSADISLIDCLFHPRYDVDTSWFIQLRDSVESIGTGVIDLHFGFVSLMATFVHEGLGAIPLSAQYKVNLKVGFPRDVMQNQEALVDGLFWSTRPTTLTISSGYDFVKYLCEKLSSRFDHPCRDKLCSSQWWHHIKDFEVESTLEIEDMKANLSVIADLLRASEMDNSVRFKFHWCSRDEAGSV